MKLLYFGTICNKENYDRMHADFRVKPSIAPFVFESALLKGFRENAVDLEVVAFPAIPAFPKSKLLAWGRRKETLETGYSATWISAINLHGIKQLCQECASRKLLKKWLKDNEKEEKAVLIYSVYQPVAKSIVALCKKYNTKCYAIIPDLPRDMYSVAYMPLAKKSLSKLYVKAAEKIQDRFDGYVYLTEHMKDVINPEAPYTVVEGIANVGEARALTPEDKAPGFVVMYAGALNEKLGIRNLIEAFLQLERKDAQLWIFGAGDCQKKIPAYVAGDERIRYFGSVSREAVLEFEKKATLLVNVRDDKDAFTKFSFPSKVIEYMLSGTPILMTKLPGIPDAYYDHAYIAENNAVETLASEMKNIANKSQEELLTFGAQAQSFIQKEKNGKVQTAKIMDLIYEKSLHV